jgi:hypothetical protein
VCEHSHKRALAAVHAASNCTRQKGGEQSAVGHTLYDAWQCKSTACLDIHQRSCVA